MQQRFFVSSIASALLLSFAIGCGASADESTDADEGSSSDSTTLGAKVDDNGAADDTNAVANGAAVNATSTSTNGAADEPADTTPRTVVDSPKPTKQCSVTKDSQGFFVRTSAKSPYVAYVPASYTGNAPMKVVVGLHGCSDNMNNFATWGVNPYDGRKTQQHIGISVGGETGNNKCWSKGNDDAKVLAAVDDLAQCFWLDRSKVVLAGYSSGGELAYKVALENADKFAGLLIEDSGLYANANPDALLKNAAWKLPIAHITHTNDRVFPLAKVQADWAKITAAGFPLSTRVTEGDHSGSSADWNTFLLPKIAGWQR